MNPESKSFSGLNTAPEASTRQSITRATVLALKWVFPCGLLTQFTREPRILGRDKDCDVQLVGKETSRRHAEIRQEGPLFMIADLASRNGLFVNGRKVPHAALKPGDVVRLGEWLGVAMPYEPDVEYTFRCIASEWFGGSRLAAVVDPAKRAAPSELPIVIEGETGTGKEGLASAIHQWSGRKGQFVGVNCATIQPELAEAALFGHSKGAFTGADRRAVGFFRAAHGGTLLLDEVTELPMQVQAKLLRALEQREITPVGETEPVKVDVRVLSATQERLQWAVNDRRFRSDLMARLDGLTVSLPPLRERREDIAPLLISFLRDRSGGQQPEVDHKMLEQLMIYDWPMNIRELSHLARRLLALHSAEPMLKRSFLPPRMLPAGTIPPPTEGQESKPPRVAAQDEESFEQLVAALRVNNGNVARAATALGISRSRAYRLLEARPDFEVACLRERGGD